mmetsp:Transcript_8812/g.21559  ORF Transcript_8812/g.21559 Transcript_8812/m.21559 type:complete len:268 (-) Transcript_8812:184-987(-)
MVVLGSGGIRPDSPHRKKCPLGTAIHLPQSESVAEFSGLFRPRTPDAFEGMIVVQCQDAVCVRRVPPGGRKGAARQVTAHHIQLSVWFCVAFVVVVVVAAIAFDVVIADFRAVQILHESAHGGLDASGCDRKRIFGPEKDGLTLAAHRIAVDRAGGRFRHHDLKIAPASIGPGFLLAVALQGLDSDSICISICISISIRRRFRTPVFFAAIGSRWNARLAIDLGQGCGKPIGGFAEFTPGVLDPRLLDSRLVSGKNHVLRSVNENRW